MDMVCAMVVELDEGSIDAAVREFDLGDDAWPVALHGRVDRG